MSPAKGMAGHEQAADIVARQALDPRAAVGIGRAAPGPVIGSFLEFGGGQHRLVLSGMVGPAAGWSALEKLAADLYNSLRPPP